jgi:thiol-disulfide isomerase/thioredoxin
MASLREWLAERRTEGIGAPASLLLLAGGLAALGLVAWRGFLERPAVRAGAPVVLARSERPAASDARYRSLEGQPGRLADYRGRVVLVDVWATWCGPCRKGLPEIAALQAEARKAGGSAEFAVVPISVDASASDVLRFLAAQPGLRLDTFLASPERGALDALGPLRAIPATFVIDREGRVRQRWTGHLPGYAARALRQALEER